MFHVQKCLVLSIFCSSILAEIRNLIIDTDGVFDDIRGLTLALKSNLKNFRIVAITTVHGGVSVEQAADNVARVLLATDQTQIPIVVGANDSIVPKGAVDVWSELFGADGVGDVPTQWPPTHIIAAASSLQQRENDAAAAIVNISKVCRNVTVVCVGPLTNLALALRRDPTLPTRIDDVIVLGGNYLAIGNTLTNSTAEFNFLMDAEAANLVLSSIHVLIVPFDTLFLKSPQYATTVKFDENLKQPTRISQFLKAITEKGRKYLAENRQNYYFVDDVAIGIAIDRQLIETSTFLYANVELTPNSVTRGQVVIDWLSTFYNSTTRQYEALDHQKNAHGWLAHEFVTGYNADKLNQYAIEAVTECHQTSNK